jgi:hypothetical protein
MMIPEKEASHYFCPLMLATIGGCRGSKCMAWRWTPVPVYEETPLTGYCGLAGIPKEA